ncbi:conserved hypothetical protein [Frankia sp. AiPs1]|uniref:hypothetical protein n=1 Tax=Frankia sp. AiPa1 TaxID=573492 RepID=UPI00202B98BC|nr:hypothetical protein [Frankia sp. AiPa1]MCL9762928.1 hypothetical protein [Frankia sp. AiPa1]
MITFGASLGLDPGGLSFGVVRFHPEPGRLVLDVHAPFDTPAAAELFVVEQRWGQDYQVCALRPVVPKALRPPVGSRLPLDRLMARSLVRRRPV